MHAILKTDSGQKLIDFEELVPLKIYFEAKYKDPSFIQQVEELMEEIKKYNLRKVANADNDNTKPMTINEFQTCGVAGSSWGF